MKLNKLSVLAIAVVTAGMMSSCHIYKKYETPTDTALTKAYVEARQQPSTALLSATCSGKTSSPTPSW